jgi:glycosyltransferase involved in cell wall biosynthesis
MKRLFKMKLVLAGDYPLNTTCGGVGQYIYIITYSNNKYIFREKDFTVHTVGRNTNIPRVLTIYSDAVNMQREIRKINPDIVHVSGTYYPYSYLCERIKSEYPLLATLHAYAGNEMWYVPITQRLNSLITYILEKRLLESINNIAVCSFDMKLLVQPKTNANISVIPNGTDFTFFKDSEYVCENEILHPSILFLGRLEKIKGIEVLIRAIPEIRRRIPNIHVYLAGEGCEKNRVKKLIRKLDIDNCVTFLGYISGHKKYFYIKSTDLFVAPSYHESFGLSTLEAMACGKAIVASNIGNIPYLIEDGKEGYLVKTGDHEELAKISIQILLNQGDGEIMGANAQRKAKCYTWNNTANLTYKLYRKILNSGI